ncbi:MAG TPA: hypothetical protein VFA50_00550 [Stellaceae bacterium]|nr:hypothetical protein [Stellaceae bacterium]
MIGEAREPRPVADEPALGVIDAAAERRWSRRRRFLFIVAAAALCWAVPIFLVLKLFY